MLLAVIKGTDILWACQLRRPVGQHETPLTTSSVIWPTASSPSLPSGSAGTSLAVLAGSGLNENQSDTGITNDERGTGTGRDGSCRLTSPCTQATTWPTSPAVSTAAARSEERR